MNNPNLKLGDNLAIVRTRLANERTFLAFFRSSVFFLGTGISILKINLFKDVLFLGWAFIILAPIMFVIGLYRMFFVKKNIKSIIEYATKQN